MKRLLPALAFGILALDVTTAVAQTARPQAGFDCAKARGDLETTICSHADIAEADRAMSIAYNALISRSTSPEFVAALKADQRMFIAIRQEAWQVKPNRQMAIEQLRDSTELRAEWLSWINPAPSEGMVGNWGNVGGGIEIKKAADGSLQMSSDVADQVAGTWLCGYNGELHEPAPKQAVGQTLAGNILLRRSGPLLEVTNHFCDETGPPINGSMKGVYFRIGADD